jgi:hypothetical protein
MAQLFRLRDANLFHGATYRSLTSSPDLLLPLLLPFFLWKAPGAHIYNFYMHQQRIDL